MVCSSVADDVVRINLTLSERSINDEDGPRIAQAVYTRLFQTEYLDLDAIPFALDAAVSKLRQEGAPPSRWVPYIHMGR